MKLSGGFELFSSNLQFISLSQEKARVSLGKSKIGVLSGLQTLRSFFCLSIHFRLKISSVMK